MPTYFVANATVTDPEGLESYLAAVPATFTGHDFEILVATNDAEALEGEPKGRRVVVLKFQDESSFRAWYDSPAYRDVIGLRLESTDGFAVLADGFETPSPDAT
jgi:uncharacterized protein (DUF1330 family)